ncbi:unnamed protein product [Vicia faba]|uniref:Uncharacterized protein n=1 Tax=Vicia faba TaxID=3906 RepID=A0AAV0ZBP0_VICFA|nr:unnamed protein product [Vicia faba]
MWTLCIISYYDKTDLDIGGIIMDDPLLDEPIRNLYLIQKDFGEETQETTMGSQDYNKDVLDISFDMLIEYQMCKENDNHIHEYVEVSIVITNGGVYENHVHVVEDEETLCEDVLYVEEDEGLYDASSMTLGVKNMFHGALASV